MTLAQQERKAHIEADAWNDNVPVGSTVEYRAAPGEQPKTYTTRTAAEVLSGHTAVVWLEGKAGCVAVASCTPTTGRN